MRSLRIFHRMEILASFPIHQNALKFSVLVVDRKLIKERGVGVLSQQTLQVYMQRQPFQNKNKQVFFFFLGEKLYLSENKR